ncbi:PRC-barrel domain-containing protein [Neptuniibacter sp. CAU 1671]|uniref:PRC-barrel domain-containing protein n=1 Tax=Neptuniibacter sp. CAU 1671 TaxID=3032593 RepID=UPI0023DC7DDA|nr:PRC-barrel domain-containing protein [Neptuniibacter sp. CAU 1671]MDF2181607.1 PRC-barrel domain-containing protein [Neptuniibacter sp. CAU 1671]
MFLNISSRTTLLTGALSALFIPAVYADAEAVVAADTSPVKVQLDAPALQVETNTPAQQTTILAGELKANSTWSDKSGDTQTEAQPQSELNPIYELTPGQLTNMIVVDSKGNTVGAVTDIVRSMSAAEYKAVITSGKILGFGGKNVAVPIEKLTVANSKIRINSSAQVLEQAAEFKGEGYISLPDDLPLREFTAIDAIPVEPTAVGGTS